MGDVNHGNANDDDGVKPLVCAIVKKNLEIVRFLLDCGVDVEKATQHGNTLSVLLIAELTHFACI